jgi:hypothetical protein
VLGNGASHAGGIDGDVTSASDAFGEDGFLFGERCVFEDEDFAGLEDAVDAFQRPSDGEVFAAADVDD